MMKIDDAYAGLWSPDEKHIALAVVPDPAYSRNMSIRVAHFSPTITQVITLTTPEYGALDPLVGWSANERTIVVNMGRPNGMRLIDIESGEVEALNQEKTCYSDMTLSPTEDKMALSSHEEYAIDEGESGWDITIQDLTEGTTKIVTGFIDEDEI